MNKIVSNAILVILSLFLTTSILNAKTVTCFKNSWNSPATIENTPLDGDECKSIYTLKQMKKNGWNVIDIKIKPNKNSFDYIYVLSDNKENKSLPTQNNSRLINNKFTIKPIGIKITNVDDNKTVINRGDLIVGQSGIVVHIYNRTRKAIIANAKVISSNSSHSTIEFFDFNDLKQDALPNAKREVKQGDILVLNYMYQSSLLLAPTQETFQTVRNSFNYNNFIHSDLFASTLKMDNQPYPTKQDIQDFAIAQNLGTLFFVVNNNVYIADSKTFKILKAYPINYNINKFSLPFYTRVEGIEESIFSPKRWDILRIFNDEDKNRSYNAYYMKLLGLD